MHGRHRPTRHTVIDALSTDTHPLMVKRVRRLEACCVAPLFVLRSNSQVGLIPGFCRDRMCPTCQHHRGRDVAARVEHAVGRMNAPRFLTLTLKHNEQPLSEMLDRLYASFRELRKSDAWLEHVQGGIGTLEVTLSNTDGCWHAHLHLLIDGVFWPQPQIRDAWLAATGDSSIVWVEAVHDRAAAARYISTYVAKPAAVHTWSPAAIVEYAKAMSGRRLVLTFGTFYNSTAPADECATTPTLVEPLASAAALARAIHRNCPYGLHARELITRAGGILCRAIGEQPAAAAKPLRDWEWTELAVCLRRIGGDGSAFLPSLEPKRRFNGGSSCGRRRDRVTLRLFNDAGNPGSQTR